ncbi:DUF3352 domain-containing protein [Pseudanabaena sp. PCC 6802]|uniref:DUF3352 domain-containing protein n=1 Tax=Pseudanabaena sp. PCC 6802 TaxID=118173 RepID=UPI000346D1D7|nr:DUF3352 domain-containing protein [Pseudanabaena sp. PCC 6802]
MSEKKSNILVPVVGAAIVAAGGAGAYFYFKNNITLGPAQVVSAAKIVPQQVIMAASISTDGAAWSQLEQFQTPETKKIFDEALKQIQASAAKNEVDFEKDIKPWAGNIMFAILPGKPAVSQSNRSQLRALPVSTSSLAQEAPATTGKGEPNLLFVVEIKDKEKANQFIEKTKSKNNQKFQQIDYRGIQINEETGSTGQPTIYAFVDNFLVLAPQKASLEKAIDTYKGGASVANSLTAENLELKNPVIQFYMPNFPDAVQQLTALNPEAAQIPQASLEQLKLIKSVNVGVGIDGDGIRLKGVTKIDPNYLKVEFKPSPGKVIAQFPSETFALISGVNIKARWEQFTQDAEKIPELKTALTEVRQQAKSSPLAIDVDKDIFGWMDGEFALAGITNSEGVLAPVGAAPALVFQTSNRPAAEALLKKLDDYIKSNSGTVETKDVSGVAVTQWSFPGAQNVISHGWYAQDAFFVTAGPLANALATKPANALDSSQAFKTITGSLLSPNLGYFYLDADKTWALITEKVPTVKSEVPPEANAFISSVRGIAGTAVMPDKSTSRFELLLALKKGGK